MAIKNYTSTVSVNQSMAEIQGALASHGARKIMVDFDEQGQPEGIAFGIETPGGPRAFNLPANVEGVRAVFAQQKVKPQEGQAERTAWRNIRDWVMAQMAIDALGGRCKKLIFERHRDRCSWAKLAVRYGKPDSTVRWWYDSAVERLGEALEEVPMYDEILARASRARV